MAPGISIALSIRMAGWVSFEEIAAWQFARALKVRVDALIARPEFKRKYRFCDQLSDSARSGPANIAEGFGRHGNKEFARFVRIAKGSEAEVLNHLIDARDQALITDDEFREAEHATRKALKAAVGLVKHLERNTPPTSF
jgi:four helix bundle protein